MAVKKVGYMIHPVAKTAIDMATRWGMVAAIPDGEDSAGRQKLRLLTPLELSLRAVETSIALELELMARGMVEIVAPDEMESKE